MPRETIIEKAIGFIPGVGKPERAKPVATAETRLAALQKDLAKLARDVEKLSQLVMAGRGDGATKPAAAKRASARKPRTTNGRSRQARAKTG